MNKLVQKITGAVTDAQDHYNFGINGVADALTNLMKGLGTQDNYIIYGCELSQNEGNVELSEGAIFKDGEIFSVAAATYSDNTVVGVETYLFVIVEENITRPTFNAGNKITRKKRSAKLASDGSNIYKEGSYYYYKNINQFAIDMDEDLQSHKSIGNNHDFLRNHIAGGAIQDMTISSSSNEITLLDASENYYNKFYKVGNLQYLYFNTPFSYTGSWGVNKWIFECTNIDNSLGYGTFHLYNVNDINLNGELVLTTAQFPILNLIGSMNSSRSTDKKNYLRLNGATSADHTILLNLPAGDYILVGDMTTKKI